jgi:hypothetical protein
LSAEADVIISSCAIAINAYKLFFICVVFINCFLFLFAIVQKREVKSGKLGERSE